MSNVQAQDCNSNGITDGCDVSCGTPGGPCDIAGCGTKPDCNSNGVPDSCDFSIPGAALDFDSSNDQVRVPRSTILEPAQELTVEAWIRVEGEVNLPARLVRNANASGYTLTANNAWDMRLQIRIDGASGGSAVAKDTVAITSYGSAWVHVAGVYSVSGNFCRLYINGALRQSVAAVGTLNYSGSDFLIGNAGSTEEYNFSIDGVRIWNVARTQAQLFENRKKVLVGNQPGLVGVWQFNEGSGQVAADSSLFGNHGILGSTSQVDAEDPSWTTPGSTMTGNDCNGNSILDACDIGSNTSLDCNGNGLPDECEMVFDCNNNGILDSCDLTGIGNCNGNNLPDNCESNADCNNNNIQDICEPGGDENCDNDSQSDLCEIFNGAEDVNDNLVPDDCEIILPSDRVQDCANFFLAPDNAIDGIRTFSRQGTALGVTLPGGLNDIGAPITCDPDGNIIVPDFLNDRVLFIQPSGQVVREISGSGLHGPAGCAITPEGNLAVSSKLSDAIIFYTLTGDYLSTFQGPAANGPDDPTCLMYDRSGNLFVTNKGQFPSTNLYNASLQFLGTPFGGSVTDMAIDSNNNPYYVSGGRVIRYNSANQSYPDLTPPGLYAMGIAIDENDHVWLTAGNTLGIFHLDATGAFVGSIPVSLGIPAAANIKLYGIAFDTRDESDCNGNSTADSCDIDSGGSVDCNLNAMPDSCEMANNDCNNNGILDDCETDCDHDGTPDVCEITAGGDCNSNQIADDCEMIDPSSSLDFGGDYVRVARSPTLEPTSELTIEAWIRPEGNGAIDNRILKSSPTGACYLLTAAGQTGLTNIALEIRSASGGNLRIADNYPLSYYFNRWHHVAAVYSATGNFSRLYIDGMLKASGSAVGTLNHGPGPMTIGNGNPNSESFDGQIDEVRIWNVARTESEIIENSHRLLLGTEAGLVGYWRFDEGVGQLTTDHSGHGNTGQFGNTTNVDTTDPTWYATGAPLIPADCNGNQTLDECELTSGASEDCNENGIPDECDNTISVTHRFKACIHGYSRLILRGNIAQWHHLQNFGMVNIPGRGAECASFQNTLIDGVEWSPVWPDPYPAAIYYDAYSSQYTDLNPPYQGAPIEIIITPLSARKPVYVVRYPTALNGYTTLVDITDDADGAWNYEFDLTMVYPAPVDCNLNDTLDACDILGNVSADCNKNFIPDECESPADCNGNLILDICESQADCDGDGVTDLCEIAACVGNDPVCIDCDGNDVPDSCDLQPRGPGVPAHAVQSPINRHYYFLTEDTMDWEYAEEYAVSLGGHLATVRNSAENQWLLETFAVTMVDEALYIGLNDEAVEGNWVWASGEPVDYVNWHPGEPNGPQFSSMDYVSIYLVTQNGTNLGTWNDSNFDLRGIIEVAPIDIDCNDNARLDQCDVSTEASVDCNENIIPDECESQADCNVNQIQDICEENGVDDCDADGITDWCETQAGAPDCDDDLSPDSCTVQTGNASLGFNDTIDQLTLPQRMISSRTQLTIEAWFRTSASGTIIGYQNSPDIFLASNFVPAIYVGLDGKLRGQFANGSVTPITSASSVNDGQWHHAALVGDVTLQHLYLDGILINSAPLIGAISHATMIYNQIGRSRSGSGWPSMAPTHHPFQGMIDEVRIWDTARTSGEILANMTMSFPFVQHGLAGYWKLNEGVGQIAGDSSGSGKHALLGANSAADPFDPDWVFAVVGTPAPEDCNGNTIPDACDIASLTSVDCNENDIPDECEPDCDNNGIPNSCESQTIAGDIDANSHLDTADVNLFVGILLGQVTNVCQIERGNMNGDSLTNGADMQGFVEAMIE